MNIISSGCVGGDPLIIEIQVEWISARLEDGDEVAAHRATDVGQLGVGFLVRPPGTIADGACTTEYRSKKTACEPKRVLPLCCTNFRRTVIRCAESPVNSGRVCSSAYPGNWSPGGSTLLSSTTRSERRSPLFVIKAKCSPSGLQLTSPARRLSAPTVAFRPSTTRRVSRRELSRLILHLLRLDVAQMLAARCEGEARDGLF